MKDNLDLNSTDYDVNCFEEDPRSINCRKEAQFTQIFLIGMTILIFIVSYIVGRGDPANFVYVFGWPLWYVLAVAIIVVIVAVGMIWGKKSFKIYSLDAIADDKETEE
ncbi:MAG: DUF997 family protein [Oscillospiraceae bacterium]|nr:DUF997 family protein [Oscillospiraceae bacterium]